MKPVHVFIVNYKSSVSLKSCLESLEGEPIAGIHVLDNFSTSQEREDVMRLAERIQLCEVTYFEENLGFGEALNRGISDAFLGPEDVLWLLNPDTVVTPGAVAALMKRLESGVDIVSPVILTGTDHDSRIWFAGGRLDKKRVRTQHLGFGEPWDSSAQTIGYSKNTFITGAAMMLTWRTWAELGGFKKAFFLYWEDADLSQRAISQGFSLGVADEARIWHEVGGSGDGDGKSRVYYYYMQRNRLWFGRQFATHCSIIAGPGLKETLALCARPLKEDSDKLGKFISSLRGLLHGLTQDPV